MEAPSRGKNRFSLNAIRLPFSSPRKQSSNKAAPDAVASSSSTADDPPEIETNDSSAPSSAPDTASNEVAPAVASMAHASQKDSNSILPASSSNQPRIRSALAAPSEDPPRRASRTASPHRVSFSPSTEEMADARELAQSSAALDKPGPTAHKPLKSANKSSVQRSANANPKLAKWRGLKSHSTSDLTAATNRLSLDSTLDYSTAARLEEAAALPGAAAAKRRLFRWDRKGIHHSSASDKGKVAKVKVTKTQAVAARHAKTLEQVINAGMGLHPIPPRLSSTTDRVLSDSDHSSEAGKKKKKVPRAKPVPVVDRSQLKGLKSALLDVDAANNIIKELRSMPVPLDVLRSGLGKIVPDAEIGTAGDHGQERILSANLPDTLLESNATKDDSDIRKRLGATPEAFDAATPARPTIERKAKSAAEEALRKITLKADASTSPQKAVVTARTSSLPPSAEDAVAPPIPSPPLSEPTTSNKAGAASSGAKPLKMVCLDCGEIEAHQRHAQHLEATAVVTEKSGGQPSSNGAFDVATIATGAAAALAGVGGLLRAPSAATSPTASQAAADEDAGLSARPPMLKSLSVSNLPTLQDGPRLMGATPLQLILDPVGTAAQNSGAFDMLADVSGAAIRATQDMDSIHPPLDRMAIFVHWWGFEITLPKATMAYLGTAHSVSGAFLSFLQTMAVGGGVPELLPFIKYISTFMEVEYKAIQAQDQGHGVCIAGTWFMPMALVPRPWDYPLDGPIAEKPSAGASPSPASIPAVGQSGAPVPMPVTPANTNAAKSPKKHAFKKHQAADPATAAVIAPATAVETARSEKIPQNLDPRHSPSSSVASTKSAALFAQLTSPGNNAAAGISSAQAGAVLSSVQERTEAGTQIKA
ncbi:hypothetical protein PHSY_000122 [Pseudozyma hubeiensis SY62]|uniref:Uncharacterized protein n=1 Tax=Pseudozyma hubeiensis (strain SY62) TaxID=1305764 RepID=R9NVN4_PSEHS|nr:hypothetical protein PHSY_000122 [Pseudozyma hubeiensis SY62]GAC92568.1 hypothetical protein PHSY_000122 [Pseudozyma hubeiensis SY62]